jgi:hypothetical protein
VSQPDRLFFTRARAATEQQAIHLGYIFALDEQLVERRVSPVGGLRS